MDTEIAAMAFTLRKLWSGLRSLWRNCPDTSSSEIVQSLKDKMQKRVDGGEDQIKSCKSTCTAVIENEMGKSFLINAKYILIVV